MILKYFKYHQYSILMLLAAAAFYWSFGYDLVREDFLKLTSLYAALFFISFKLIKLEKGNFWFLVIAAVLLRLVFITALPNLSQDFYRFIWDGKLMLEGINPYLFTPEDLLQENLPFAHAEELVSKMGELSAGNFTSYPPVNQLLFAVSALIGNGIVASAVVMRLLIILADLGILYFGKKLLEQLQLPSHRIFWYLLNPFVIIEFTGNLHFEGVMLFFLIWALYLLYKNKWIWSAVLFGISVSVKLLPLLLLPLLLKYFRRKEYEENFSLKNIDFKRLFGFYSICFLVTLLGFVPFASAEFLQNFMQSIGLWFKKFEFNASLYYLARWVGYEIKGYNVIIHIGKFLPIITFLVTILIALKQKKLDFQSFIVSFLFGTTAYLFLSTTVHPWYLATPLLLSIFTPYRYMLLWSALVVLSYAAYATSQYQENLWLVAMEYVAVFGYFGVELYLKKSATA